MFPHGRSGCCCTSVSSLERVGAGKMHGFAPTTPASVRTTSGKEPRRASYPNIRGVGLVRERMLLKRSLTMKSISGCVMM